MVPQLLLLCPGFTQISCFSCTSVSESVCRAIGEFGGSWPDGNNPPGCYQDVDNKFYYNMDSQSTAACSGNKPCICEGVPRCVRVVGNVACRMAWSGAEGDAV